MVSVQVSLDALSIPALPRSYLEPFHIGAPRRKDSVLCTRVK